MIKIILTDDHRLFRDGIKSLINNKKDISVVGEFDNGQETLESIPGLLPDLIITDISMPGISGIELTRIVSEMYPCIPVLILSMHNDEEFIRNSIKAGACGYLPKDIHGEELLSAIYSIARGETYFSKEVSNLVMKSLINKAKNNSSLEEEEKSLTKREREIIKLVGEGLINKEIADYLNISIRTVDCHKNNIKQKLKVKSTVDIVKYAIKNEFIEL